MTMGDKSLSLRICKPLKPAGGLPLSLASRFALVAQQLSGPRGASRVHDIRLQLPAGRLLHVHGASGSGKTTLLRLLARLDPLESGTLELDGQPAEAVPVTEWRRRVALVFQESRLFPGTVADNLNWGARLHGRQADVDALLRHVGLDVEPDQPAAQLSGGEAKRLAIARALAVGPDVLLLDEPTGPLDESHRRLLRILIQRLCRDHHFGVVLVSHLDEDLLLLHGDAIHLQEGLVVAQKDSKKLHQELRAEGSG